MRPSLFRSPGRLLDAANWTAGSLLAALVCLAVTRAGAAVPTTGMLTPGGTTPVTWVGDAPGTGADSATASNETACMDSGPAHNCDIYTLTVGPGDYTGKIVTISVSWKLPTDEYDLFVHQGDLKGPLVGVSANGVADTQQAVTINTVKLLAPAPGVYTVHVGYAVTPGAGPANTDQYTGSASVQANTNPTRTATYVAGDAQFSPNVTVKAPVTVADGEPSSRTDNKGNYYIGGIRGVPAGVDLWTTNVLNDPLMLNYHWQGQPDSFTGRNDVVLGADGGGDIDIAVGLPTDGTLPILAYSSLVAANISTGTTANPNKTTGTTGSRSDADAMPTYQLNPVGNNTGGPGVDDRQWMEFFGKDSVYLLYRTISVPPLGFIQRSDSTPAAGGMVARPAGFAYQPPTALGPTSQTGNIAVDQNDGTVYASFNDGTVFVGTPPVNPTTGATIMDPLTNTPAAPVRYNTYQAATDPNGVAHIFFPIKVARDGTAYVVYSNEHNIYLESSTNKGQTWSAPVQVNKPGVTLTNLLPWLETGPSGAVGVIWYGTTDPINEDAANWRVYYAQTFNAKDASPNFAQVEAGDHVIHASNISEGGTTGMANRNLLDYFQLSYAPDGSALIGYTDDHNDFNGHCYITHQIAGTSIQNTTLVAPVPAGLPGPPPTVPPAPSFPTPTFLPGAQVVDYANDVSALLLVNINGAGVNPNAGPGITTLPSQTGAVDILSVKYSSVRTARGPAITATIQVANLSSMPPGGMTARMSFAANAPSAGISPTGQYSFAVPDRGDQFYVQATLNAAGQASYTYGTTVRASTGALTNTSVGTADAGAFDPIHNTITVRVSSAKLNALIKPGVDALGNPHSFIASGSVLAGLRAVTFGAGTSLVAGDETRGGTQYAIP